MPSLHRSPDSPYFRIRFRFDGKNVNRSLHTKDRRKALGLCSRVEETIELIERGQLEVPKKADPIDFILSGGQKKKKKQKKPKVVGLAKFFSLYQASLPAGHKEESTLEGEAIHIKHFKRILGQNKAVKAINEAELQRYANKRLNEEHHGKRIQPDTVRKELVTFRMLWNWGVKEGLLTGRSPTRYVALPLVDEKPPFMTRKEIAAILARGGVSKAEESRLWEAVYLDTREVSEVLEVVKKSARYPFIYPMMLFVAHTSARRSELVRSLVEDVDFHSNTVLLREKKKSRKKAMTYRRVDMSPLLRDVMKAWIDTHPGGRSTFCQLRGIGNATPLTIWQAQHHLKQTFKNTKWKFVTGFHVFRHSFASNLAAAGVDQRVIDEFMGHQTEEMRRRYRHLFPAQRQAAINSVFGTDDDDGKNVLPFRA